MYGMEMEQENHMKDDDRNLKAAVHSHSMLSSLQWAVVVAGSQGEVSYPMGYVEQSIHIHAIGITEGR